MKAAAKNHFWWSLFSGLKATVVALLFIVSGCTSDNRVASEIVFAAGPDDTGTVQRIVESFNAANEGRIRVTWREMDRDNNTHHQQLVAELGSDSGAPHVFASDVVWTAEFAQNGWVEDLTRQFYDAYGWADFLESAHHSASYRLRIWGVPWYTDASILFYRKDLLAGSGFDAPPATWSELADVARRVMQDSGIPGGIVFQGARYEGGTANAAEFIWSAGGEIMRGELTLTSPLRGTLTETDVVTINSEAAASGLDLARRLITDGIAPQAVSGFREKEALAAFLAGETVFLRSWPYVQGILRQSGLSEANVGVAPLPAATAENNGYSCLGGWNLMVNANASKGEQAAAWEFIRYLTSPEQQKRQALEAGLLPAIQSLYQDPEVLRKVPVAGLVRNELSGRIRGRPQSPFYSEISAQVAKAFNAVLMGEMSGAEAVESLDQDLRTIVTRNR